MFPMNANKAVTGLWMCRQRLRRYYPPWVWALPTSILRIPYSLLVAILCTVILYWVMGYDTDAGRCALDGCSPCLL